MKTQLIPIGLFIIASIFGALGQVFYKKGSEKLATAGLANLELWLGCLLFCAVMVFFVLAYKLGGKVSVVYPFYGFTFVWGALLAQGFLKESLTPWQWCGIFLVCLGTMIVATTSGKGV